MFAIPFATVATVRSCVQPSAAVRKCLREVAVAVPLGTLARVVMFGGFNHCGTWFCVAGVGLRALGSKLLCMTGAMLQGLQKMTCASAILRGKRGTLGVMCCTLFRITLVKS